MSELTEKEKYFAWEKDAIENRGLIEVLPFFNVDYIHANNITEEEIYRELNYWNYQMDNDLGVKIINL
jgi:hypothetical protein